MTDILRTTALVGAAAFLMTTLVPKPYAAAQATSPQIINLSCQGTMTWYVVGSDGQKNGLKGVPDEKAPDKESIVINLTDGTVSGGWGVVARITKTDGPYVHFSGTGTGSLSLGTDWGVQGPFLLTVSGQIDRITGDATVYSETVIKKNDNTKNTVHSADTLTCKNTKPQF